MQCNVICTRPIGVAAGVLLFIDMQQTFLTDVGWRHKDMFDSKIGARNTLHPVTLVHV